MSKSIRVLWAACTAVLLLVGGFLATVFWQAYPQARLLVDLLAKDGRMERFTPDLYARLELPMRLLGPGLILLGLAGVVFRHRAQRGLERIVSYIRRSLVRWWLDISLSMKDIAGELSQIPRRQWAFLLAMVLIGAGLRGLLISRPMFHDEAYTYEAFASASLKFITSDYHLPNNHVFHTLLVHLSTQLFGNSPWAIRLPACLAGTLLIPCAYLLAHKLYGRAVAALSASLVAVFPILIDYSTNARGYTLLALLTLILLLLSIYVQHHRNLAAWSLIVILGAVGFYTVPVMLYPFGGVLAWLLLSTLALTIAILALLTLPWQRYVMPLVPLTCLWIAYSLDTLFHVLKIKT